MMLPGQSSTFVLVKLKHDYARLPLHSDLTTAAMSTPARTALRASRLATLRPVALRRGFADAKENAAEGAKVLQKGARRDPELIVSGMGGSGGG